MKQILDKPLSHLFSVRLWTHSSYEEFFGQWWHMGYISWAGCLTLPCWYERSGSSSCGLSEGCFPSAEENMKTHFNMHFVVLQSEACRISAILVFNSYFKSITKSAHMHDEYTLSFSKKQDFTYYLLYLLNIRKLSVVKGILPLRKKLFFCQIGSYYV